MLDSYVLTVCVLTVCVLTVIVRDVFDDAQASLAILQLSSDFMLTNCRDQGDDSTSMPILKPMKDGL